MRFLLKLGSFLLWLTLISIVLLCCTALSWWMGWPLVTGAVILLGVLALLLAFFGLRILLRWRNKRVFVRSVLTEQQKHETAPGVASNPLQDIWQQGMAVLDASPLRVRMHSHYSQPWYLALDDTTAGSPLFNEFGRNVPDSPEHAPLAWHFLSGAVILQTPVATNDLNDARTTAAWESLLTLLAHDHRKMALQGLLLVLSADDLLLSAESLRARGLRLRSRLQQLMLTMSRQFPVFVLIQDMEHVPGMTELGQRLPPEITDSPLGCLVDTHTVNAGFHAATLAIARLKSALQDAAVEGVPPSGDELLALEHLTGLGKQLGILLEQAFKDVPHQATPLLRGVYFAHTQPLTSAAFPFPDTKEGQTPAASPRPPFLTELLTHVIPSTAGLAQPLRSWFSLYATTKVMGMAAWLLALLFVCGVLGVNTVYQHHVLTAEQKHVDLLTHSQVVNDLYKQMQYARYLEHARTSWYLPTLGQDMIGIVERKAKDAFLQASFSQLLLPVLTSIRTFLIDPATAKKKNEQLDVAKELSWICEVMADRLEKGHTIDNEALPLTVFSQKTWTPLNGELVRTSLDWVEDEAQLQHFSHDLQQLLAYSLSRESGNMLRLMTDNINAFTSDSRVCLSQFWSHLPTSADADICVPTRYTVAGQTQLQDSLDDILIISGRNPVLVQEIERFLDAYYRDYAKAWQAFINKSNAVQLDVLRGDAFTPYAELKSAAQLPQTLLLQRLAKELVPLIKSKNPPAWVDSLELTNTMVTLALSSSNTTATLWDTVLTLVQSSPETLSVLRKNTRDNAEMRAVLQAVPNMQTYFTQILDIAHSLASPAQALPLASMHYGTGELGDVSKSPFTEAEKHLTAALKPTPGDNPAKALLRDMLTTMKQGVTVQAARELQRRWENDVLGDPINLYRPNDTTAIYGQQGNDKEKGLVPTFVEANLKPFLKRDGSDLVAASWGTLDFPFTTDFLHSLSRAEALAVTPTRSSYTVLLRSQPTLVNVEANERPDSTNVSLQCPGKKVQLSNRNYPQEQTFEYDVAACGEAALQIVFPSMTLNRTYASFADLLEEFQYGEREFFREDFPEAVDRLNAAKVNKITVRLLPDNVSDVLARKNNTAPTLQDRITYVW